jgi:hypothetical protein
MSDTIKKHFTDITEEQMVFVLMKFKGLEDKFSIPFGKRVIYHSDWYKLYER